MHPILGHFRRLLLYLAAWGPISAILVYLFASAGGLSWGWAAALAIPLSLVYAFVCLSAWYTCRSFRLDNSTRWLGPLIASGVASLLWIAIAKGLTVGLSATPYFGPLDQQAGRIYSLLFGSGVLLYLTAVALHYVLLTNEAAHEATKRELQAQALARDSELKALKTQVNPHFIFNCLNSISALTSSDPATAREMCIRLAEFLRKTLGLGERSQITLREELELVHAYLSVEQMRFGARLKLEESVEPTVLVYSVPPLLLQRHQQQLRHAQHAVHRGANFVAYHREEFSFSAQGFVHHGEGLFERTRAFVYEALQLRGMGLEALIGLVQLHALVFEQLFGLFARPALAFYAAQNDFHFIGQGPGCQRAVLSAHWRASVKRTRLPSSVDSCSRVIATFSLKWPAQPRISPSARSAKWRLDE